MREPKVPFFSFLFFFFLDVLNGGQAADAVGGTAASTRAIKLPLIPISLSP